MKHPADIFPLTSLIPSYLFEASQLHAYLEGGDREVLRYQYHPLWYQVPYQKYQVVPLLTISRREAPRKFVQLVPKLSKWFPLNRPTLKITSATTSFRFFTCLRPGYFS